MGRRTKHTDAQKLTHLSSLEYHVTQEKGTEPPFTGRYWDHHAVGIYRCVVCVNELFRSDTKYDSGTGWPSFYEPASPDALMEVRDTSHGMVRTEIVCSQCGAHLGHVFPDGPKPTGLRYCTNSAALRFEPRGDVAKGYVSGADCAAQAARRDTTGSWKEKGA